jgi:hypothetical protein
MSSFPNVISALLAFISGSFKDSFSAALLLGKYSDVVSFWSVSSESTLGEGERH